jgi:hypothetical protein
MRFLPLTTLILTAALMGSLPAAQAATAGPICRAARAPRIADGTC